MLRNANPNGGIGLNSLYAACKVTLHKIGIALEKTSNPESGTEKAPAIVTNEKDKSITYTITVKNKCQELPLTGVVVEDAIPAGLIIDAKYIRMESTVEKDPEKLKQNVTQKIEGQKLTWTIATLDKGESIKFTVPTKLEKKFTKNTTFANCAHVTEANGKKITVDSDTTYHQVPVDIPVTKVWKDYDGKDLTTTPDKVTVALYGDQKQLETLDLEKKDSWKGTFKDVPSNDPKTGEPYTFTVKEVGTNANGLIQIQNDWYTASVVGDQTQGFTVTNTKHKPWTPIVPATTSLTVTKAWSGVARNYYGAASVTVELYKNGQATGMKATLNKANQFTATFNNLKTVDDVAQPQQNQYTAKELDANGKALANGDKVTILNKDYTVRYGQVAGGKQTITNMLVNPMRTVSGKKIWNDHGNVDGLRPKTITVRLLADGKEVQKRTVDKGQDGKWEFAFTNCPTYDKGTPITYTITEDQVAFYTTKIDGTTITNSHRPKPTPPTPNPPTPNPPTPNPPTPNPPTPNPPTPNPPTPNPPTPVEPNKPKPVEPTPSKPSTKTPKAPKTGDIASMLLCGGAFLLSSFGYAASKVKRGKRKHEE